MGKTHRRETMTPAAVSALKVVKRELKEDTSGPTSRGHNLFQEEPREPNGETAVVESSTEGYTDTFAVELLLAGIPLERVSVLLGHQSIRITEKHYAPWVRSRQEQLERDLASAWSRDPLVLAEGRAFDRVN